MLLQHKYYLHPQSQFLSTSILVLIFRYWQATVASVWLVETHVHLQRDFEALVIIYDARGGKRESGWFKQECLLDDAQLYPTYF